MNKYPKCSDGMCQECNRCYEEMRYLYNEAMDELEALKKEKFRMDQRPFYIKMIEDMAALRKKLKDGVLKRNQTKT